MTESQIIDIINLTEIISDLCVEYERYESQFKRRLIKEKIKKHALEMTNLLGLKKDIRNEQRRIQRNKE